MPPPPRKPIVRRTWYEVNWLMRSARLGTHRRSGRFEVRPSSTPGPDGWVQLEVTAQVLVTTHDLKHVVEGRYITYISLRGRVDLAKAAWEALTRAEEIALAVWHDRGVSCRCRACCK